MRRASAARKCAPAGELAARAAPQAATAMARQWPCHCRAHSSSTCAGIASTSNSGSRAGRMAMQAQQRPALAARAAAAADEAQLARASLQVSVCRPRDVPEVAAISAQAFGFGNFPGVDGEAIVQLEERYAVAVKREVTEKLAEALQRKEEAAQLHREYRLRRSSQVMRAQLAQLRGSRAVLPRPETREERREVQKWLRLRRFVCVLVRDGESGELMGCASVSLMQAEAVFPPPMPSNAPLRLYVSNMAVSERRRRRGVASALLRQCERIGRVWGYDSVWLHVGVMNTGAQALYDKSGYSVVNKGMMLAGPLRQVLMSKQLVPLRKSSAPGADSDAATKVCGSPAVGPGAMRSDDGVYVWGAMAATTAATLGPSSSAGDRLMERMQTVDLTTMESTPVEPTTMQSTQAESTTSQSGVPSIKAEDPAGGGASPAAARRGGDLDYGLREHDSSMDATTVDATAQSLDAGDVGVRDAGASAATVGADVAGRHGSASMHVEDEGAGVAAPGRSEANHAAAAAFDQDHHAGMASNEDQLHAHHGASAGEDGAGLGCGDGGRDGGEGSGAE